MQGRGTITVNFASRRWALGGLLIALLLFGAGSAGATDGGSAEPQPQCFDNEDNDEDGLIDFPEDPECLDQNHDSESGAEAQAAGGGGQGGQTYYQGVVGAASVAALASAEPTLPSGLAIDDAGATAAYLAQPSGGWELRIEDFLRNHERVEAIYDMVLVLPMPVTPEGGDAFTAKKRGILVEEGRPGRSAPLVYGGEKVVMKRNVGLEKALLPRLVGDGAGKLPALDGSGYRWTAWDAIMSRDEGFADTVQARAVLHYEAADGVEPPDPSDARFAAYLITWIPALPASVPPYAVRIDVQGPAE